jgi:ferredoxin
MYDRDYGWPERPRQDYRALPPAQRWSELCLECDRCSEACPYGVDAAAGVGAARRLG